MRTYQPTFNLQERFPFLKPRTTVVLHPRKSAAPLARDASKIGGHFVWPRGEPWPHCPEDGSAMVAVLQLRKDEFGELPFPPDTDLFQLFWTLEQDYVLDEERNGPHTRIVWRKMPVNEALLEPNQVPMPPDDAEDDLMPVECELSPERIEELPGWNNLEHLNPNPIYQINQWIEENCGKEIDALRARMRELGASDLRLRLMDLKSYCESWSISPSTKIGGYVAWVQNAYFPSCDDCKKPMEHLLTIASCDGYRSRWYPIDRNFNESYKSGPGLDIAGLGTFYCFFCRFCPRMPIKCDIQR